MTEPVARLKIELREIEPRLWRRVDVPLSSTLLTLHDIIQAAFGWTDSHLFEFVIGDRVYGEPLPDDDFRDRHVFKAAGVRLKALIGRGVERFLYVYDFGDDWRHDIFIESVGDGEGDVDTSVARMSGQLDLLEQEFVVAPSNPAADIRALSPTSKATTPGRVSSASPPRPRQGRHTGRSFRQPRDPENRLEGRPRATETERDNDKAASRNAWRLGLEGFVDGALTARRSCSNLLLNWHQSSPLYLRTGCSPCDLISTASLTFRHAHIHVRPQRVGPRLRRRRCARLLPHP